MNSLLQKVGENPYVTPTNLSAKQTTAVSVPNDAFHGVDYVSYAIPISPDDFSVHDERWDRDRKTSKKDDSVYDNYRCEFMVGFAQVNLYLMPAAGRLKVSFNPSRIYSHATSATLCPPDAVTKATELVLHEILLMFGGTSFGTVNLESGEIALRQNWESLLRVKRLDAARDFHFDTQYLELLATTWEKVQPKGNRTQVKYKRKSVGSLYLGQLTKREGNDKIYNKAGQLREKYGDDTLVANGMMRYETEIKSNRLKTSGIHTLKDITAENVWRATERFWNATGYAVNVFAPSSEVKALDGLSDTLKFTMRGFLEYAAEGQVDMTDRSIKRRYNLAIELGLQPGLPVESFGAKIGEVNLFAGGISN